MDEKNVELANQDFDDEAGPIRGHQMKRGYNKIKQYENEEKNYDDNYQYNPYMHNHFHHSHDLNKNQNIEEGNMNKLKQKILNKIKKKGMIIIFLGMFHINLLEMLFIFSKDFNLEYEQNGYFVVAIIVYIIPIYYYLNILKYIDPSQTDIDDYHRRYPTIYVKDILNNENYPKTCEYCEKKQLKNFRSSHCRECNMCILKRDHHCAWAGTCIGYKNMNYFFCYLIWLLIFFIHYLMGVSQSYNNHKHSIFVDFLLFFTTGFDFTVFFLVITLIWQKLVEFMNERTFNENRNRQFEKYICCLKSKYLAGAEFNEFNKGWLYNFKLCIGPTLFHWFFPLPKQIKYNIIERNKVFQKAAVPGKYETIKALSGIKYGPLESIIKDQEAAMNPSKFIQIAKNYYMKPNVEII